VPGGGFGLTPIQHHHASVEWNLQTYLPRPIIIKVLHGSNLLLQLTSPVVLAKVIFLNSSNQA